MNTPFSTDELDILEFLSQRRGTDFRAYKPSTVRRRLQDRMCQAGCTDLAGYRTRLDVDPEECDRLLDKLTINVSAFFRNLLVWSTIRERVIPEILEKAAIAGRRSLHVWSAGCARGQEAYSAAILFHHAIQDGRAGDLELRVHASDLDERALRDAKAGRFLREDLENVPLGLVDRYFIQRGEDFEVCPEIRDRVRFSRGDLTSVRSADAAQEQLGVFHLVLCRNVLIYFNRELQARVLGQLCRHIGPGGYLVLGDSETLLPGICDDLKSVDERLHIWSRGGGATSKEWYRNG